MKTGLSVGALFVVSAAAALLTATGLLEFALDVLAFAAFAFAGVVVSAPPQLNEAAEAAKAVIRNAFRNVMFGLLR
jgi:mannose/cellobiose epimerase-like protein (N-acyl-D-glucosamine 2-epimerase family)